MSTAQKIGNLAIDEIIVLLVGKLATYLLLIICTLDGLDAYFSYVATIEFWTLHYDFVFFNRVINYFQCFVGIIWFGFGSRLTKHELTLLVVKHGRDLARPLCRDEHVIPCVHHDEQHKKSKSSHVPDRITKSKFQWWFSIWCSENHLKHFWCVELVHVLSNQIQVGIGLSFSGLSSWGLPSTGKCSGKASCPNVSAAVAPVFGQHILTMSASNRAKYGERI